MTTDEPTAPAAETPDHAQRVTIEAIEALAVAIAREAGELARLALGRAIAVEYKPDANGMDGTHDPVSEADRAIEALVRERVAARFPDHAVIGEEVEDAAPDAMAAAPDSPAAPAAEYLWVIDPIDGTANFVNGFPLFAISIGVLRSGRPVASAVWCGATHALGPGVYHAHEGSPLFLDGEAVAGARAVGVRRRLAAAPGGATGGTAEWDHRVTGSIAVEVALVAAGVFEAATFFAPRIWDVAGGVLLVRAAGREVWVREAGGWTPFDRFTAPARGTRRRRVPESPPRPPTVRDWRQPLLVGTAEATALVRARTERRTGGIRVRNLVRRLARTLLRTLGRAGGGAR